MDEHKYNLKESLAELDKLFDLSTEETDKTACEALAEKARIIYEQHPKSEDIALPYALILFNLSTVQTELKERKATVEKLEKLQQQFQDSHDIAEAFARILFNLSTKQTELKERKATAEKLEKLQQQFQDSPDIALRYARILVNLSTEQTELKEWKATAEKLEKLQQQFQDSHDIALRYARILVNLSTVQTELKEIEITAEKLEKLQQQFQDSPDIALQYAMILFNLSIVQTELKEIEATVEKLEKLEKLQQQFQDSPDIALRYARILVNLSTKQTELKEQKATVEKLEKLQQQFQDSHDIAEAFARILFNLSTKQTELKERKATAEKLEKLQQQFQDSPDIALQYAGILFNLSNKQTELNKLETTAKKLQELHEHEPFRESEEIAFIYGMFLAILFNHQTELIERRQTTKIIKKLYDKFSKFMIQNFDDLFFSNDNVCDSDEYKLFNIILREGLLKNTKYAILQTWVERYKEDPSELKNLLSIYQLVQKIKYELGLKAEDKNRKLKFGHYTSGKALQSILGKEDKAPFSISGKTRLNNANYMNDPEEGVILEDILKLEKRNPLEPSSWFLMSFTSKTDDLAMWSQYGNNAEGVCIVLNESDFARYHSLSDLPWYQKNSDKQIGHKMNSSIEVQNNTSSNESNKEMTTISNDNTQNSEDKHSTPNNDKDYLYRVAYLHYSNNQFDIEESELFTNEEVTRLKGLLVDLKSELRDYKNSEDPFYKKAIADCIEEIRYLFKSVDYKYEEELRILQYANLRSDNDKIKIDYSPEFGKLYLERKENIQIREVIFGPKFPNPEYVTPLLKLLDKEIKYKKSTIKFR